MFDIFPKRYQLAAVKDSNLEEMNTGVMIIGKDFLNEKITENLINIANPGHSHNGDQSIINAMLFNNFSHLPIWYNCLKTDFRHAGSWLCKTKILHFIAKKPWQKFDNSYHYRGNLECSYAETLWFKIAETISFLGEEKCLR
jgi:lipopolysaccharide biosynthesis glycosyltransferase